MNWYIKVIQNYTNFKGRARRKEYWMFILINILITIALSYTDTIVHFNNPFVSGVSALQSVYALAVLMPGIAVFVRRMHNIGKSGFWFFIVFVPIIGWIWLIVLLTTEGKSGRNRYGSDPKRKSVNIMY
jgi:uncharacterized membrane protein YhaH (DUF805 family)